MGISVAGKQPVPSGEPATVKISVTNTGTGTVKNAKLTVTFPWSAEYLGCSSNIQCQDTDQTQNKAKQWTCRIGEIGSEHEENTADLLFSMTPTGISDVRTELVLASLTYTYEREKTEKVQVAWGPAQ